MNLKGIQWLNAELPALVEQGILSPEVADRLRAHYAAQDTEARLPWALLICGVLGALLIGLGVILVIASNWADFPRTAKTGISFAPLIVGQLLSAYVLWFRRASAPWAEAVGVFHALAIGACISLISQTYHISGDLGSFLLTWALLGLPLVYLHNASAVAVLYMIAITAWAGAVQSEGGTAVLFWAWAALIVPHLLGANLRDKQGIRYYFLTWAAALCMTVALGIVMERALPGLWLLAYPAMFACMVLGDGLWPGATTQTLRRPLFTVGSCGIAVLSLVFTYEHPWNRIGYGYYRWGAHYSTWGSVADHALTTALVCGAGALFVLALLRGKLSLLLLGVAPFLALAGYLAAMITDDETVPLILFNVYMLVLGLGTTATGVTRGSLSIVNGGLIILGALIIARFSDSELGIMLRGIVFICLGAAFLAANVFLLRRRKAAS